MQMPNINDTELRWLNLPGLFVRTGFWPFTLIKHTKWAAFNALHFNELSLPPSWSDFNKVHRPFVKYFIPFASFASMQKLKWLYDCCLSNFRSIHTVVEIWFCWVGFFAWHSNFHFHWPSKLAYLQVPMNRRNYVCQSQIARANNNRPEISLWHFLGEFMFAAPYHFCYRFAWLDPRGFYVKRM